MHLVFGFQGGSREFYFISLSVTGSLLEQKKILRSEKKKDETLQFNKERNDKKCNKKKHRNSTLDRSPSRPQEEKTNKS